MTENTQKASESVKNMPINDKISAAVYIGAYTIQMLVGRVAADGNSFETVNEFTAFTKLAGDDSSLEQLSEDGMKRAFKALHELHEIAEREGATECRLSASSSFRNTVNRTQLLLGCQREFGVFPQLLCGRDEARLNFIGAMTDAFINLPLITVYCGFSSFQIAFGDARRIEGAFELGLGAGQLVRKFELDKHGLSFFRQIALRNYIAKQLEPISASYHKWLGSLKVAPELMAVGALPFACNSLINKQVNLNWSSIAALPQKTSAVVELSKSLIALSPEEVGRLPGVDQNMRETLAGGSMILRSALEFCDVYDFRLTPYGLCAGMLKSPASSFSTAKTYPLP